MQPGKFVSVLCLALVAAVSARADFVNGTAWNVPAATAENVPAAGSVPGAGATEIATFTANGVSFCGDFSDTFGGVPCSSSSYTLGSFLASGAANNITYMNGGSASTTLSTGTTGVLFEFTGMAAFTTGQTFQVLHDDGLQMYVNGVSVLSQPGPTAPTVSTFTYTGASGTFSFDFIYGECCGAPAAFQTSLIPNVSGVPEPGTAPLVAIFGLGLVAASAARWRLSKP